MFVEVPILRITFSRASAPIADFDPQLATICPLISRLKLQYLKLIRVFLFLAQITVFGEQMSLAIQQCRDEILDKLKSIRLAVNAVLFGWSVRAAAAELLDDSMERGTLAAINRRANGCGEEQSIVVVNPAVISEFFPHSKREVSTGIQLNAPSMHCVDLEYCAYLKVPHKKTVIITGGLSREQPYQQETAAVHSISQITGEILLLRPMRCPRSQHAIILMWETVYVFGGVKSGRVLSSAERCSVTGDIATAKWEEIPQEMCAPRCQFTACALFGQVYLVGGMCRSAELFDPPSNRFSLLPLVLQEPSHCATVTDGEELIVISQSFRTRWRVGETRAREDKHEPWPCTSESPPVLWRRVMYTAGRGKLSAFNVDSKVDVTPRRPF